VSDERVTRLETHREGDQAVIAHLSRQVDEIHTDVQEIKRQLDRQKGFFAGMMFILLPIWSAFTAAAITFWDKITQGLS
jgi:hypothetical protein